ncbi:hypothetical protein QCA50_008674 [Cerrena zonata]|uniref:Uncharacterized protein n=1 Tax=Cerrena zonata TaxID=2478898 RepID=A0AAW0G4Q3_9APHY
MSPFTRLFAIISVVVTTGAVAVNNTKNSGTVKFLEVTADDLPSPAVNLAPQDFTVGEVWTKIQFDGDAAFLPVYGIPSSCCNILTGSDFDNMISSIGVISGISRTFFV